MKTYSDNGYKYFYDWHLQLWTSFKIDAKGNQVGNADYSNNKTHLKTKYPFFQFKIDGVYSELDNKKGNEIIANFWGLSKQIENGETLLPDYHKDLLRMIKVIDHIEKGEYSFRIHKNKVSVFMGKNITHTEWKGSRMDNLWISLVSVCKLLS